MGVDRHEPLSCQVIGRPKNFNLQVIYFLSMDGFLSLISLRDTMMKLLCSLQEPLMEKGYKLGISLSWYQREP